MKKRFYGILFFVLSLPTICMAQGSINMRSLAIDQMYEYGQAIYQRGDYPQAAIIFTKILAMDPTHRGAVGVAQALQEKGQTVIIPARTQELAPVIQEAAEKVIENNYGNIFQDKTVVFSAEVEPSIEVSGANQDLKQDIQNTNQAIQRLKEDISHLRTQMAKGQEDLEKNKKEELLK